jgi:hypothetical protein
MKIGGIISAKIPYGFDSQDKELKENMRFSSSDLRYQVTLLSILKKQAANCQ